jgi:uncharacterized RDD family membrane protein YckC
MQNELVIVSPEKTILTYRLAGLGARLSAFLLDTIIIIAIMVGFTVLGAMSFLREATGGAFYIFVMITFPYLYFILFEAYMRGQTPGKVANKIRVRMEDGSPITPIAAVGRNLFLVADLFPGFGFVGITSVLLSERSQRVGDLLARTVVVTEAVRPGSVAVSPHIMGIHPQESLVGSLDGMTMEEYVALRRLCDRYPALGPEQGERLLRSIFLPIAERRRIPIVSNIHPLYLAEATVMKYGREHGLL